jgi:hypothetical protein
MKMKTKLITLGLLGGMFDLIWIGASIVLVYFLYGALANDGPWFYLSWPFAVGFIARRIAVAFKDGKQRVDYVDQLIERGYEQNDAEAAWRTAFGGGLNLLRNLQQVELSDEIHRLETAISTPNVGENST